MGEIVRIVTENPLVAVAVGIAAALLLYLLFKSLIKLVLILILVAVVIYGYFYLRHPESRPADLRGAVEQVRTGADKAVDQGKSAYEKGRKLVGKGKDVYEKGKEWVDRGKEVLERGVNSGKDTTAPEESGGDLGTKPERERAGGKRQKNL